MASLFRRNGGCRRWQPGRWSCARADRRFVFRCHFVWDAEWAERPGAHDRRAMVESFTEQ
jgi:hypothetical protein